ncbi:MAG: hydrolase [Planctomycetales bacterium]|nr:hydrolase [Planctomycetales bacterium]
MNTDSWLAEQSESMLADVIELAELNSGSENVSGLYAVADWIKNWMHLPQAAFRSVQLPPRFEINTRGQPASFPTGPLLRWDFQPTADRRILLAIHYDTVYGATHPFQRCVRSGNRLIGPGVADAKGGIVVLRYALQAWQRFFQNNDFGWTVILNPDEELGSPSTASYWNEIAEEFDFGLLMEPALPGGELVANRKGSGNYCLTVHGRAAHAGRHFEEGRNAISKLARVIERLDALNGQRPGLSVNVGFVQGGGPVNIVPDLAQLRFNVRVATDQCMQWFEDQLALIVDQAEHLDYQLELSGGITSPPKSVDAKQLELMGILESVYADTHLPVPEWISTGGVCDGNKLAAAGLPNLDTLGPIGGNLHSDQEWMNVPSLVLKAQLLVKLLQRLALPDNGLRHVQSSR